MYFSLFQRENKYCLSTGGAVFLNMSLLLLFCGLYSWLVHGRVCLVSIHLLKMRKKVTSVMKDVILIPAILMLLWYVSSPKMTCLFHRRLRMIVRCVVIVFIDFVFKTFYSECWYDWCGKLYDDLNNTNIACSTNWASWLDVIFNFRDYIMTWWHQQCQCNAVSTMLSAEVRECDVTIHYSALQRRS